MSWLSALGRSISLFTPFTLSTGTRPFTSSPALEKAYKLKTHQGAKKRWKALPNGNYKHWRPGKTHGNSHLSRIRLHNLGLGTYATPGQRKQLRRLLPYA